MLDGQRLPGSPALGADSVNINMLPMVAIQRMDILADGASAVYGSDAVAGVVNLVTHKQFDGIEISMRYGDRDLDDGGDRSIGLIAGASNDRGSVVFAAEYSQRDPIFDSDRAYTAAFVDDAGYGDGDGLDELYVDTDGISYYGRTWEIYDPTTNIDPETGLANGYYALAAAADCPTTGGFMGVFGAEALGEPNGTACGYAYANVSANRAELEKVNTYLYGTFDVSDNVQLYAKGLFSKVDSFGRYAPPAAGWRNPSPDHPHNPFDIDALIASGDISVDPETGEPNYELYGYYRWTNIGPRNNYVADTQYDFTLGFNGDISDNVAFEFYFQTGQYDSKDVGKYYLDYPGFDYVLANQIDPFSPLGVGAMRALTMQDNQTTQDKLYAHVQFGTGDLFGAGESIALVGAESVEIGYINQFDPGSEVGLVGGSAGNSSDGERDFSSVFFEWLLPTTENSELNVAGRYDNYSDFGNAFSPTVSFNINVTDELALRARWGQGFKAPALSALYGPETFSAEDAQDPLTGVARQFDTYYYTNPDLDAEESESVSLGMNWEYIEGHSFDLAYYQVKVTDVITQPSAQSLIFADIAGVSFDPNGTRVDRQINNNVDAIYSYYTNAGDLEVNGVDFQLASTWDTGAGLFDARLFWSHQLDYKQNAYYQGGFQDTAGFNLQPTDRAQGSLTWTMSDLAVDLVFNYIGPHGALDSVDEDTGVLTTSSEDLDSWTTANLAIRYDMGAFGRIKVGANNVTGEDPVMDAFDLYARDHYDLYDPLGRVYYMEYRKTFD